MKKRLLPLVPALLAGLVCPVAAQVAPAPAALVAGQGVYTFVEQMPELPGGGGAGAIRAAILKNLRYLAQATPGPAGTVFVRFVVTATGEVANPTIVKGVSNDFDAAVLAAVRQLPRFVPGKQHGRAVSVAETIPVKQPAAAAPTPGPNASAGSETFPNDSSKVYTYVEQEAALPGGGGMAAIRAALQQRLVLPAGTPAGQVFVRFTVGPRGAAYNGYIVKGLSVAADAAVLAAVGQLPRFVPGMLNGRAVAYSFTVPVAIGSPPPAGTAR